MQDFFISHAGADKRNYIEPFVKQLSTNGITYWLDSLEISWGDSLALKINEGLKESKFVILCLSKNFLGRSWPEVELNAAFAMQNRSGQKKVLPLILNSKDEVIQSYPIIGGLIYRHFDEGFDTLTGALKSLVKKSEIPEGHLRISIESKFTGQISDIIVSPKVSVGWLVSQAMKGAGLRDTLDTGGFQQFRIRWILVDSRAEDYWRDLPMWKKSRIYAVVKGESGVFVATDKYEKLEYLEVYNNIIFHLYAIEDNNDDDGVVYSAMPTN